MSDGTKVMWHKRKHVKPRVSSVFWQPVCDQEFNCVTEAQKANINVVGIRIFFFLPFLHPHRRRYRLWMTSQPLLSLNLFRLFLSYTAINIIPNCHVVTVFFNIYYLFCMLHYSK